MFKLIKFFFWLFSVLIFAYFISDFQIGGKTIKQQIDDHVVQGPLKEYKDKIYHWLSSKQSVVQTVPDTKGTAEEPKSEPENITTEDSKDLQKVIEKNQ